MRKSYISNNESVQFDFVLVLVFQKFESWNKAEGEL